MSRFKFPQITLTEWAIIAIIGGLLAAMALGPKKPSRLPPESAKLVEQIMVESFAAQNTRFEIARIDNNKLAQAMYLIKDKETGYEFMYISGSGITKIK